MFHSASGISMGSNCQSTFGLVSMIFAVIALGCTITALVFAIMNLKSLPEEDDLVDSDEMDEDEPSNTGPTKTLGKGRNRE